MDFPRQRRGFKELNLTALIDIVFHLMVFVMLTTSFVVSESMELSLPSAHSKSTPAQVAKTMRIQIAPDGTLQVDDKAMTMGNLNGALAERLGDNPETRIAVLTTAGVTVQQLIHVMDAVYLTGGRNVQVDKVI